MGGRIAGPHQRIDAAAIRRDFSSHLIEKPVGGPHTRANKLPTRSVGSFYRPMHGHLYWPFAERYKTNASNQEPWTFHPRRPQLLTSGHLGKGPCPQIKWSPDEKTICLQIHNITHPSYNHANQPCTPLTEPMVVSNRLHGLLEVPRLIKELPHPPIDQPNT
ncbi:hypothetical protein XELAEV_18019852mg [Xenopus laevis]|uniref:Uncharacterized protein n=1 Tax=Xenopus laevis TaxID=8355 RepID=A0A974D8N2_XENLA|nr:hypothetical protein XELAEV_18019852mg [Xenopus laevis]